MSCQTTSTSEKTIAHTLHILRELHSKCMPLSNTEMPVKWTTYTSNYMCTQLLRLYNPLLMVLCNSLWTLCCWKTARQVQCLCLTKRKILRSTNFINHENLWGITCICRQCVPPGEFLYMCQWVWQGWTGGYIWVKWVPGSRVGWVTERTLYVLRNS